MKKLIQSRTLARRLKRLTLITVVAMNVVFVGRASAQNLVMNGDFTANASSFSGGYGQIFSSPPSGVEDWSRNATTKDDGISGSGTMTSYSHYSAPPGYGSSDPAVYYFQENFQSADNVLSQDLTLQTGTTYTLTFEGAAKVRLGTDVPLPVGTVTITDGDGTLADVTVMSATDAGTDFMTYETTFTTLNNVSGAVIKLSQTQTNPATAPNTANQYAADFIDYSDIVLKKDAAPEPGTYGLLGLGALALGLVFRRQANRA